MNTKLDEIKGKNGVPKKSKVIDPKPELIAVILDGKKKKSSSKSLAQVNVSIDPAIMEKVKQTADIVFSDSNSPERMKTKLQIKGMGYNPKQSKLMRTKLSNVANTSNENGKEAQNVLLKLQKEADKIFPVLDKATNAKGFVHKMTKYIPFVGGKVGDYLIKLQSIQKTMENMVGSLEGAEKELVNTNTELDTLKQANMEDIEKLKQQVAFGNLLVEEIKSRMLALPPTSGTVGGIDKKTMIEKDVLLPLITRISDLNQKAIVSYQGIMNMANIKEGNDALINGLRRAQEVTMFALEQTLIQFMASNSQREKFDGLDKLNAGTGRLIAKLSTNIKDQSIAIAEKTTSLTLDIETLKQAWNDSKTTLLEVQKIYKDALPKMESQVRVLEEMNKDAEEFIKKIENKDITGNASLQIIEDLGK